MFGSRGFFSGGAEDGGVACAAASSPTPAVSPTLDRGAGGVVLPRVRRETVRSAGPALRYSATSADCRAAPS
eukprot:447701-Pyramimonas_sp.AAC.1